MTDNRKGEFFRDVVAAVEQTGHKLCVLRGYRDYPEYIGDDIDVIMNDPDLLPDILSRQNIGTVVQIFEHETTHYYLQRWDDGKPVFILLDVSRDYTQQGRLIFRGEEFLKSHRTFKFFDIPTAGLEFASYLVRKVAQGSVDDDQARRLTSLYREDPQESAQRLARFFAEPDVAFISEAARSGEWEQVRGKLKHLRKAMFSRMDREQPLQVPRYWLGVVWRRVDRILHPPGLMVAFLGTDGSGKSTIMARVEQDLGPGFWGRRLYHKRPLSSPFRWTKKHRLQPPLRTGERGNASGFNPHALPPRGLVYSLAKLGFWWLDFLLLGCVAEIFPRLTSLTLLLFDRYYQDLLVDPRRYHYGGPMWLARLVGHFIPQPHLLILLDAPPEVLYTRKQELPLEETTRQREAYLELVQGLSNGYVVDTSRPLDEAVTEVEQIILDYMSNRVVQRLKLRKSSPF